MTNQEPKIPEQFTLVLPRQRVDQVLQALARLPWMEVADTISQIQQQADASIREFNAPAEAPAEAPAKTAKR
jgi:hypothetical protein